MIEENLRTNWNAYYDRPFKSALITRKYTTQVLIGFIKKYVEKKDFTLTEIGGANSCFYEKIAEAFQPQKYIIIDNNQLGLDKFRERLGNLKEVELYNQDIFAPDPTEQTDVVFSVGLIEHFDLLGTKESILNHLQYLRRPGILIISFPTPTLLYKITRKLAELTGLWLFPDERPLRLKEVEKTVASFGRIVDKKILWPLFLTQYIIVVKVN
jgi:SAM-dependent methyltransferase